MKYKRRRLPKEFVSHLHCLSGKDLVIDIGANVGMVSECMAMRGAKVISFEPNKEAFARLDKVAARYSNITIKNVAAGTSNCTKKLYLHKDVEKTKADLTQASSLLVDKPNVSAKLYEEVKEIDFSNFLQSINRTVELIKIDIEGYEIELINHLLDNKALGNVNKIYVETHDRKIETLRGPTDALKERIVKEGLVEKFFYNWH